jgi:hypothetical protein
MSPECPPPVHYTFQPSRVAETKYTSALFRYKIYDTNCNRRIAQIADLITVLRFRLRQHHLASYHHLSEAYKSLHSARVESMAHVFGITAGVISIVTLLSGLMSSMVSTIYDMRSAGREILELQHELENVKKVLESIQGLVESGSKKLGHVGKLSDSCEEISQICGNFFVGSKLSRPRILQPTMVDHKSQNSNLRSILTGDRATNIVPIPILSSKLSKSCAKVGRMKGWIQEIF